MIKLLQHSVAGDFALKKIRLSAREEVMLNLWDIGGETLDAFEVHRGPHVWGGNGGGGGVRRKRTALSVPPKPTLSRKLSLFIYH